MVQSQFSLTWESYKSSICSGFSSLQQNGEFVDMTLAADGHFVKVHQVLMALSSPYLKDLISSAPCQHPVIFLNNVSHKTLSLLLEYIYTGEVLVPSDTLASFVETSKALHVKGLENISSNDNMAFKMEMNTPHSENISTCKATSVKKVPISSRPSIGKISLPPTARKIVYKKEDSSGIPPETHVKTSTINIVKEEGHQFTDIMDDTGAQDDDSDDGFTEDTSTANPQNANNSTPPSNLQFTVSIRGSLQIILNRYMYNLHSTSYTGLRRWRCVDYRNNKCSAFVVTKGNVVLNRANLHNHSFHDKKILAKIEKNAVYSAIDDVQGYKEKENPNDDSSMEQDEFLSNI